MPLRDRESILVANAKRTDDLENLPTKERTHGTLHPHLVASCSDSWLLGKLVAL